MKVILFCGGLGLRLRDYSQNTPKPLVPIGNRPILWHLMNYYAHFGHKDFILCLGYQAAAIKEYFLNYQEALSNDFVLSEGGREVTLLKRDIDDWRITFVDTGLHSNIGERLVAVRGHLEGEDVFLANYADGLSDLPLDAYVDNFMKKGRTACFLSVRPNAMFHVVRTDEDGAVQALESMSEANIRINGGYFIFRQNIFDYIQKGDELVLEPFERLISANQLSAHSYDGFWRCMDTFKDRQALDDMFAREEAPWQVWKDSPDR